MAAGQISKFITSFSSDVSRPCLFTVGILLRNSINMDMERDIVLRCESAELPGRTFSLVDQKTYGPIEQYPVQSAYNKCTLTFICSDTMDERVYFDKWMNYISYSTPTYSVKNPPQYASVRFDFNYKNNYVADLFINQHNVAGEIVYKSTLVEAFPVECHSMPLNWGQVNDYNKVVVTFAYRYAFSESDKTKLNSQ